MQTLHTSYYLQNFTSKELWVTEHHISRLRVASPCKPHGIQHQANPWNRKQTNSVQHLWCVCQ